MRHTIDPSIQIGPQARAAGFTEPYRNVVLYRFVDAAGALLYVGITSRPTERWQKHRRQAQWWPQVSEVLVEVYAQRHQAEAAELDAIKSERPLFNVHAAPTRSASDVDEIPTSFARYSRVVLPRVGGGVGVGVRGGSGVIHASRLTSGESAPVDNATAAPTCDRLAWMALRASGGGC